MTARRRASLYFSFRSPFSWLLVRRLLERLPDAGERIEFIPYWEPDPRMAGALGERGASVLYAPMSSAKHRYILQDTKRLAAGMGLRIAWPIDTDAWWEPSHLGWLMARRRGRALAFYEAVTAARWERGEDISRPATIRAASTAAGLDADLVATCASAGTGSGGSTAWTPSWTPTRPGRRRRLPGSPPRDRPGRPTTPTRQAAAAETLPPPRDADAQFEATLCVGRCRQTTIQAESATIDRVGLGAEA